MVSNSNVHKKIDQVKENQLFNVYFGCFLPTSLKDCNLQNNSSSKNRPVPEKRVLLVVVCINSDFKSQCIFKYKI